MEHSKQRAKSRDCSWPKQHTGESPDVLDESGLGTAAGCLKEGQYQGKGHQLDLPGACVLITRTQIHCQHLRKPLQHHSKEAKHVLELEAPNPLMLVMGGRDQGSFPSPHNGMTETYNKYVYVFWWMDSRPGTFRNSKSIG